MEKKNRQFKSFICFLILVSIFPVARARQTPQQQQARRIFDAAGIKGGLIVHIDCGDGKLTAALRANDNCLVHGLDKDAEDIDKARKNIKSLGLYGKVSVEQWTDDRLPYADNLVNLVVTEELGDVTISEVLRVLAPLGVAYVQQDGEWMKTVKPWPDQIDEWTHFRHSAEGNMVSRDELIGPPRYVQWISDPVFQRHHGIVPSITTVVSSVGRMFYLIDEAPLGLCGMPDQWHLVARDAFSGVLLWKRPMEEWGSRAWSYWTEGHSARFNHPLHVRKRLIAAGDRVYVTLGFNTPVTALDAATGKTVMTYTDATYPDEFVYRDGILYVASNDRSQEPWPGEGVEPAPPANPPSPSQKHIWAIEADTGGVLWKAGPFLGNAAKPDRLGSMRHLNLTVGTKGVFLVDEQDIVGLDVETGRQRWRIERLRHPVTPEKGYSIGDLYHKLISPNTHTVIYHNDILYVLHPSSFGGFKSAAIGIVQALSPETGEELWRHETAIPIAYLEQPDIFGIGDTIWIPDRKEMTLIALDAATGKEKRTISINKALDVVHHHRCYPNRATQYYAILGRRGAEFVDLASGQITLNHWARGGCRYGHMLANGLFYRLPDPCKCYMSFQPRGFIAMASEKSADSFKACLDDANPLERGPAYGNIDAANVSYEDEWPTFRHDAMRSSSATTELSRILKSAWQIEIGGKLTCPVVASGKVLCCTEDDHQVHAFDATTGRKIWSFTAGGRVDSPPTISRGMALFGCRDGWVYCLHAADGELVWRFRAAPGERRIVAFGQVESVWPVHGSVLIVGDTAYFVAGRSSMLDTGIYAYAVDVASGELLDRVQLQEVQTETKTTGQLPQGVLSDILSTDGEGVYLRERRLNLDALVKDVWPAALAATRPRLFADGGFFNKRWFHRSFWHYRSNRSTATGNLIAFNAERVYVAAANHPGGNNQSFHIPVGGYQDRIIGTDGQGPAWCAYPNLQYGGCVLFAAQARGDRKVEPIQIADRPLLGKNRKPPAPAVWMSPRFSLMPWAIVIANKTLFVAGPLDKMDEIDPWATFEGRAGGVLSVLAADTGEVVAEHKLTAPPVWNGMAAADGKLFITLTDGTVMCFE